MCISSWKGGPITGFASTDLPGTALDIRWRLIESNIHLFSIDKGGIHIFGTDAAADIYARTLQAVWTSLAVGTIGVHKLCAGFGIGGYQGIPADDRLHDSDADRRYQTVPAIPLFMALMAFVPMNGVRRPASFLPRLFA